MQPAGGASTSPSSAFPADRGWWRCIVLLALHLAAGGGAEQAAAQIPEGLRPGDILVADYFAGNAGNGMLFWIDRATGARRVVTDLSDSTQGPTGTSAYCVAVPDISTIYLVDSWAFHNHGQLFRVEATTGFRTVVSDFGNAAQGPLGVLPLCPAVIDSELFVTDRDAGTSERGALFRVNTANGHRTLVSDFGNPNQGPLGESPHQISRGLGGTILVADADAGTGRLGAIFQIDPVSGARTIVSDLGEPNQGPTGINPGGVTQGAAGLLLVADTTAGTAETGLLFTVDSLTGARTVLSRFGDLTQGVTGVEPFHLTVGANGSILVVDPDGGTDIPNDNTPGGNGALFAVNRFTGQRTMLSDFGNVAQGPIGGNPNGIAIVPMVQPGDLLVALQVPAGNGVLFSINPTTGVRVPASDFGNTALGPTSAAALDVALGSRGDILFVDWQIGVFVVDPANGARTLRSNFGNSAQGPIAAQPEGATVEPDGTILAVTARGEGADVFGKLMRVDPVTGARTLLSDFGDLQHGTIGKSPRAVEVTTTGTVVADSDAATPFGGSSRGAVFRVDPATGFRTVVSDFGNPAQGAIGVEPWDVVTDLAGQFLVTDRNASSVQGGFGVLFSVHPVTGVRTIVSDFGDTALGPGRDPVGVARTLAGDVFVLDQAAGTVGFGAVVQVEPVTGLRTMISDFGTTVQGTMTRTPWGIAVYEHVPPVRPGVPVADDGVLTTAEDTLGTGTLTASDPNGDPLIFSLVSTGSLGTAVLTDATAGTYRYTPNANVAGTDSFTFRVNDGTADSNVAAIVITIDPVNDAPEATPGTLSVAAGANASGTLVATDIENDPLTFSVVSPPGQGTVVISDPLTGAYVYTANAGASGADSFSFAASDGTDQSNAAIVSVTIDATNQPPVAQDASYTTTEDKPLSGTVKATDPDRAKLTYAIVSPGSRGTATVTNASTGRFSYVPHANVSGIDTFSFRASDGALWSNIATVTVTISPVNDAPAAQNLALETTVNVPVIGQLVAVDPDGDGLTFSMGKGRGPRRGTAAISLDGHVTYTPSPGFVGSDSFTFQVSDGVASASATISVVVRSP